MAKKFIAPPLRSKEWRDQKQAVRKMQQALDKMYEACQLVKGTPTADALNAAAISLLLWFQQVVRDVFDDKNWHGETDSDQDDEDEDE